MSVILKVVSKLENSVSKLEDSVMSLEGTVAGQQRDMFTKPAKVANGSNGMQGAIMAQRLDQAIEKVEKLLSEG